MKTPPLEQGSALILAGPQGCGKSRLAQLIGSRHGGVAGIDATHLSQPGHLNAVLRTQPTVLIVDGLPKGQEQMSAIKSLLGNPTVSIRPAYSREKVSVKSPLVIICTNEIVPQALREERRFRVVDMPARATA